MKLNSTKPRRVNAYIVELTYRRYKWNTKYPPNVAKIMIPLRKAYATRKAIKKSRSKVRNSHAD
jgi:hypothetical protein